MPIFLIFALIIAVLAVVFALQNTAAVQVTFLAWKTTGSLALVLLMTLIAGAVVSYLAVLPGMLKDKWTMRGLRRRLNETEASLAVHKSKLADAETRLQAAQQPNKPEEPKPEPPKPPASTLPPDLPSQFSPDRF